MWNHTPPILVSFITPSKIIHVSSIQRFKILNKFQSLCIPFSLYIQIKGQTPFTSSKSKGKGRKQSEQGRPNTNKTMAIRFSKFFLVAIAIATLVQYSTAQTTHVVGDSLGWTVPANGAVTYSNWAANKTFTVGDILVFNYAAGSHDVTQVTQSSFNACNITSPISRTTNTPANINLTTTGAHYYICSFPGHCLGGQKLAINVSASATAPAPQPSSPPPPASAPTPTPTPAPAGPAPTPTPTGSAPTPTPAPAPAPPAPTPTTTPTPTPAPTSPTTPSPTGATPPPATAPTQQSPDGGVTSPPPPNNSVKSLGTAGLFTSFLAIVLALLN